MTFCGRAWVFADDVDTDVLAPGAYLKLPVEDLAKHCLESIDPRFASSVQAGDIVVAGRNFGMGSSREQAAECLKVLGVSAVLARSFARIFYRNAFNLGLPALFFEAAGSVKAGDLLDIDPKAGRVRNETQGQTHTCTPIPDNLMDMVEAGGLIEHLKRRSSATART